ncbi:XdhC family protein [Paenibacillus sp. NEAU-GSW1]|uniref:XdhC family protein n=1 Tax=Paenibacillus sp. NEAU-GSW1 TaxID=2682486 RepID=UPI0015657F35|nr:XdhC/CoxI family protein [Paenibacillus sp. NEAU-GSW1]
MHHVLDAVKMLEQRAMLATIISVEGHAYRKPGASMLIMEDGGVVGTISPGCLEGDLKERTAAITAIPGSWDIVSYNMDPDEDAVWGEAIGCGGKIEVLVEAVDGLLLQALQCMDDLLALGEAVRFSRFMDNKGLNYTVENAAALNEAAAPLAPIVDRPQLFSTVVSPRERVIVFGAGIDAEPISRLLQQSGFRVVIADWRQSLLNRERFAGAELTHSFTAADMARNIGLGSEDYIVVLSHQLLRDREWIRNCLISGVHYIGVIGSKRRIELLFEGEPLPPSVHAPIGLDIGADGPIEIAISVAAEMIAVRTAARRAKASTIGGGQNESVRHLFGGREKQPHGEPEAGAGVERRGAAWRPGAACSIR